MTHNNETGFNYLYIIIKKSLYKIKIMCILILIYIFLYKKKIK